MYTCTCICLSYSSVHNIRMYCMRTFIFQVHNSLQKQVGFIHLEENNKFRLNIGKLE